MNPNQEDSPLTDCKENMLNESSFDRFEPGSEEAETKLSLNTAKEHGGNFKRSRNRSGNVYDSITTETRRALIRLTME